MRIMNNGNIVIENRYIRFVIDQMCVAQSLIYKETEEELIEEKERLPLFAISQQRPFNNEVKLAHMNKYTTYPAAGLSYEGNCLTVSFEEIPCKAVVRVTEREEYITFTLDGFYASKNDYPGAMDIPPVDSFRLLQLPFRHREEFGEWLNIVSGGGVSACVIASSPYELVDSEKRASCRILYADVKEDIKLQGTTAALMVCPTERLLDTMDRFERDFNLPGGVASRRGGRMNSSILRVPFLTPENADEYIRYAKMGGFQLMLLYYTAMCREKPGYYFCGNYDYRDCYPDKEASLKAVLDKLKTSGITPGLHFLHTHIGIESRYVTPVPDHRLRLKKHFTLARPLDPSDTTVYVEEDPGNSARNPKCRVLRFGKELIAYESFSADRPWRFEGCRRGHWGTAALKHEAGQIGGLLDISEFGGTSIYLEQDSSLQDEIADKIAGIYNCGFEFAYFDGSEGTDPPFAYHVSNAQYKVFSRFQKPPIFCEGAAKTHFSWHMITGGNAFDVFPDAVFKEKIVEFPFREAKQLRADYTRVNFGWWAFRKETQPDMYEFGTSRAAAWDCPVTVNVPSLEVLSANPRTADIFEVIRRWEDVRARGWLTKEQKEALKDPKQEHILLINEAGDYELVPYTQICCKCEDIRAFVFSRQKKNYVVFWHKTGQGNLRLSFAGEYTLETEPGRSDLDAFRRGEEILLTAAGRRYFSSAEPAEALIAAFENAVSAE